MKTIKLTIQKQNEMASVLAKRIDKIIKSDSDTYAQFSYCAGGINWQYRFQNDDRGNLIIRVQDPMGLMWIRYNDLGKGKYEKYSFQLVQKYVERITTPLPF